MMITRNYSRFETNENIASFQANNNSINEPRTFTEYLVDNGGRLAVSEGSRHSIILYPEKFFHTNLQLQPIPPYSKTSSVTQADSSMVFKSLTKSLSKAKASATSSDSSKTKNSKSSSK